MQVLVAYASKHGSTGRIAQGIADRLRELGHKAEEHSVDDITELGDAGAVVLGSAIYAGSWMKEATRFAEQHATDLAELPVWLFSSGPLGSAIEDEEQQPRQLEALSALLEPKGHRVFFGALDRDALGFAERMMVKAVKAPEGDFRDWDAIWAWADEIASELET